ncbi:MAG TPA: hypothetical protein PKD91_03110 [Bacteroidia bacterium]|nr:hypothetical protein [Bacteroidia bacterium]
MFKFKKIREYENLHILLWLLKDTCWVMLWEIPGMIMIIPTLAVAVHITWIRRHIISDLFHNLAVCMWISANSIWMTGEFFLEDSLRPIAMVFFMSGLVTVLFYYLRVLPKNNRSQNTKEMND